MILVNLDSFSAGLCETCPHLVFSKGESMCGVRRLCGQILACRAQERALAVGRYPSGRVRKTALKGRLRSNKVVEKPELWEKTHARFAQLGRERRLVWIRHLSPVQQTVARRLVRDGRITGHTIEGAVTRGKPAIFIDPNEFNQFHKNQISL